MSLDFKRILCPVDATTNSHPRRSRTELSSGSGRGLFLAAGLGCLKVEFRLLHVGTERGMPTLYLPHQPNWKWEECLLPGNPVERILKEDADWSPDLIVMATQGHMDFLDALRGSTTERVLRGAHCPVLAVPAS